MKRSLKTIHSPAGLVMRVRAEKNGLSSLRTLIVLFLIFLQFVFMFTLHFFLAEAFQWYMVLSLVLSILCCLRTLSSDRSPSSKAVWIFIILFFFYVGYLLYFISDEKFFFGRSRRRYKKVFARAEGYFPADGVKAGCARAEEDCEYLSSVGGFCAYGGTQGKYFPSGGLFFDDVLARLATAKKFILIEFFIICDGILFDRIMSVLTERVKQGVEVLVIYDDMGTNRRISGKAKRRMRGAGLKLMSFNRLIPVIDIGMNYRDHRKIVDIDGETAYTGGINLADEYTNDCRNLGYWKDAGIRVDGNAAAGFTKIFLRQWEYLTRREVDYASYLPQKLNAPTGSAYAPFASGLDIEKPIGKDMYLNIISKAEKRLYIMTPYFVPDDGITNMLANKAKSGVDVRIVLPGVPDKAVVYRVTLGNARALIASGVKGYLMRNTFVHSKVVLADYCVVVGSINVDMRSFFQQFESALYCDDPEILAEVLADFERTFPECDPLLPRLQSLHGKFISSVMKIISPLM